MQLSATTIAAKPLPSDLIPEALSPYILSSCFQSPSRRHCHLSKDGFSLSLRRVKRKVFADGVDVAEFKGCEQSQPWMIRAGLGG